MKSVRWFSSSSSWYIEITSKGHALLRHVVIEFPDHNMLYNSVSYSCYHGSDIEACSRSDLFLLVWESLVVTSMGRLHLLISGVVNSDWWCWGFSRNTGTTVFRCGDCITIPKESLIELYNRVKFRYRYVWVIGWVTYGSVRVWSPVGAEPARFTWSSSFEWEAGSTPKCSVGLPVGIDVSVSGVPACWTLNDGDTLAVWFIDGVACNQSYQMGQLG